MNNETEKSTDKIYILQPDKTIITVPVEKKVIIIGRDPKSDIVLNHPGISRQHARIEFDGKDYFVQDLNSMNGTYLGEVRIPPGVSQVWSAGENLRVGEIWLRLERAEMEQTTVATVVDATRPFPSEVSSTTRASYARPDGSFIDSSQVKLSSGEGRIGIYLETTQITLTPGSSETLSMAIFNLGKAADTFRIQIMGIPHEWILNLSPSISIPSGGQREVPLTFRPVRSPESRAGRHSVTIRISSQSNASEVVEQRISLTLSAFFQFTSELRPAQIQPGEAAQVIIQNMGNLPETFTISWEDKDLTLSFEPPQTRITIPEGQAVSIDFKPSLTRSRWLGGKAFHPFSVHIHSQDGQTQSHDGEFISRGLIPTWSIVLLSTLCVIMACAFSIFFVQYSIKERNLQKTTIAGPTASAQMILNTHQAETATAVAISNANQATIQAITATAAWQLLDDDQDGLNNSQELQLGTKPDVDDTDADGLLDGEEISQYKTNPLIADTDGDGLKDGEEIQRGTNPNKKDTDGDGIEDKVDPDPLHPPTPTPSRTPLPTVTATILTTPTRTSKPTETNTPTPLLADLSISINNGPSSSVPGTNTSYTIYVTNKGPSSVTNAVLVDNFPAILTNITWICTASIGSRCQVANGTGNINTRLDLAVNGSATLTASGTISPSALGLLINSASITPPDGIYEANSVDNLAIDTDTLTPKVTFTFTKTDGRISIFPGQTTSYTIAVTSSGPSAASGVAINDTFPNELMNITWICVASPGSSCASTGLQTGNLNTLVNLLPGGTATFTVNGMVKPSATGTINNIAYLSSPIDPVTNNKTVTDSTTITPQAELRVEVSAPLIVSVSTPITYTITVINAGPSTASNLTLSSSIPSGTSFVSSNPASPTCVPGAGQVTCNLGNLSSGSSIQVTIVLLAPGSPATLTIETKATATETDTNPADNKVNTIIQVQ